MSAVVDALNNHGYTQEGAESNYFSSINGLAAFDGGTMSGWMGTLNDWFTNYGFADITVASGNLESGDEIAIMYTSNGYGEDIGGTWANNDTTVKSVEITGAELTGEFDPSVTDYTLTIDTPSADVNVVPTATNKTSRQENIRMNIFLLTTVRFTREVRLLMFLTVTKLS